MGQAKITFVGDIMCEPRLLKAAKHDQGFDFSPVFQHVKELFAQADFVIGNLETPLAGKDAGFTSSLFEFNTPDAFADAIKQAGIHLVTTANNHCLDRNLEGLQRTMQVLREKDIPFTGTFPSPEERKEAAYFTIGETRFAVVSYTYGTNYAANHILLEEQQQSMVNLLRPQQERYYIVKKQKRTLKWRIIGRLLSYFSEEQQFHVRKFLRMTVNQAHADDHLNLETAKPYIEKMQADILTARQHADVVLFCPHVGGQFNLEPGAFSCYVMEKAVEAGCDAVIASHAHVVQTCQKIQNVPCFFSIGNFSMSPNSVYLVRDHLPEYGLAVHLYFNGASLEKISFSILKMIENCGKELTVVPTDQLYAQTKDDVLLENIRRIHQTVTGQFDDEFRVSQEYFFESLPRGKRDKL